jgi:hypothetical protein
MGVVMLLGMHLLYVADQSPVCNSPICPKSDALRVSKIALFSIAASLVKIRFPSSPLRWIRLRWSVSRMYMVACHNLLSSLTPFLSKANCFIKSGVIFKATCNF